LPAEIKWSLDDVEMKEYSAEIKVTQAAESGSQHQQINAIGSAAHKLP